MDEKKHIEELTRVICQSNRDDICGYDRKPCHFECGSYQLATKVYNAGYCKASEIFEEIEEGIKAAISALQFENNPIHRKVKHETYSSLMRFIKTVEQKYTGG